MELLFPSTATCAESLQRVKRLVDGTSQGREPHNGDIIASLIPHSRIFMHRVVLASLTNKSPYVFSRIFHRNFSTLQEKEIVQGNSSTGRFLQISSETAVQAFHQRLYSTTRDSLWVLLNRLARVSQRGKAPDLHEALRNAGIAYESYNEWLDVIVAPDFRRALELIWQRNNVVPLQGLHIPMPLLPSDLMSIKAITLPNLSHTITCQPPTWLTLHLLSSSITSLSSIELCAPFILTQLSDTPQKYVAPMIVLGVQALSRWSYEHLLCNLLHYFMQPNGIDNPATMYNMLLQALSRFPTHSALVAECMFHVLITMQTINIRPHSRTYTALLSSESLTMDIAKHLREKITQEERTPTFSQLNTYLAFLDQVGHKGSEEYLALVRRQSTTVDRSNLDLPHERNLEEPALVTQDGSAGDLVSQSLKVPNSVLQPRKDAIVDERVLSFRRLTLLPRHEVPLDVLLEIFEDGLGHIRDNARQLRAWHTSAILGLIARKQHLIAKNIFQEYVELGQAPDRTLLRAGLQATILAGDPRDAFNILVKQTKSRNPRTQDHARLRVDTITLNVFMNACYRIGRSDLVFKLWDCTIRGLMGCTPDGSTMGITLDTARLGGGVRGLGLDLGRVFRSRLLVRERRPLKDLEDLLHKDNAQNSRHSSSWDGEPPAWRARTEFLGLLFNTYPQLSADSDPMLKKPLAPFPSSRQAFFAYLHLLVSLELGEDIPQLLNWMSRLSIPFDRELLTMAVVGWTEHNASEGGVIGSGGSGETFIDWLRDFGVRGDGGTDILPTEQDIGKMRTRLWFEMQARRKAR